jgi:copper(I)-binding protein
MPVSNSSGPRITAAGRVLIGLIAAAVALTGCSQRAAGVPPIRIASAYIMQSAGANTVAAYLVIANSGPDDRLLGVRSSAGGQVLMFGPGAHGVSATAALSQLLVPGHSVTRLDPSGYRLEIVHSGRLRQGIDVTLTLDFARAGTMRVPAQVNNPATNSGYLGP